MIGTEGARLLREMRVKGRPSRRKACAWRGNQRCDEGDVLVQLVPEHHLVRQLWISPSFVKTFFIPNAFGLRRTPFVYKLKNGNYTTV
ncbi:hypothetical protein J7J00_15005 [Bacillus sp. ISL-4]|uniref:hypothetical protein n=1 Tax=Bacillus sp. ISL-4 TaxID=2819125 RepID=UPI001BE85C62|nr:hypothetical protein [Bacillus sp. ISL-4]MBT2666807.1 hypothetical protein [Bacillus sp. ISL-4]